MTMMRQELGAGMVIAALAAGCGTGVSSAPTGDVKVEPCSADCLAAAPKVTFAGVLDSGTLGSAGINDGSYMAVVRDPDDAATARLVKRRPDEDRTTELDRMTIADGTAQVLPGAAGTVWGFGGNGSDPGAFRLVRDASASDIAFGDRAPSFAIYHHDTSLFYTSTRDCAIEQIDLATGVATRKSDISCSTRVDSVLVSGLSLVLDISDGQGHAIRQMDAVFPGTSDPLIGGLAAVTSPFSETAPGEWPPRALWVGRDGNGDSPVYRAKTDIHPAPVDMITTIPGPVDAAALVNGDVWGATVGEPSTLFHVTSTGLVRYQVGYTPRSLIGLDHLLVVQTADGGLIEQPIGDTE